MSSSLCVYGFSSTALAEESKQTNGVPPIFSSTMPQASGTPPPASATANKTPNNSSYVATLQKISEGLPKFDSQISGQDLFRTAIPSTSDLPKPVLMETLTVFDTRLPEFNKPLESELEKIVRTGSVFRYNGKTFSSEMTFLDLVEQYHWKPQYSTSTGNQHQVYYFLVIRVQKRVLLGTLSQLWGFTCGTVRRQSSRPPRCRRTVQ